MSIISIPISGLLLCLISPMSIDRIGKLSGQFASNHGVDYVVMMTGNEVYVSRTKSDSPIVLERMNENEATRSYYPRTASLKVTDSEKEYTVYGSGDIETSIELFPQAYKNAGWAFLVSCEMKEQKNQLRRIFCRFAWHAAQTDTEWNYGVASSCDSNTTIARLNISHP